MTRTVREILTEALAERERFRALLIQQAEEHDDHARATRSPQARQGAINAKNACLAAYDDVVHGTVDDLCTDKRHVGKFVAALITACKMLGVPAAERTAALVEHDTTTNWKEL